MYILPANSPMKLGVLCGGGNRVSVQPAPDMLSASVDVRHLILAKRNFRPDGTNSRASFHQPIPRHEMLRRTDRNA